MVGWIYIGGEGGVEVESLFRAKRWIEGVKVDLLGSAMSMMVANCTGPSSQEEERNELNSLTRLLFAVVWQIGRFDS